MSGSRDVQLIALLELAVERAEVAHTPEATVVRVLADWTDEPDLTTADPLPG